jgi:hypothetical protein
MSHCIISMPPSEMGDSFDCFLHQLNSPEPCFLTWDDYLRPNVEDFQYQLRYCSEPAVTDEPMRWATILFEPGDVVEFRLRPPRETEQQMQPRQFLKSTTTRQHGIYPWTFANEVGVIVNKLSQLNQGDATWWGLPGMTEGTWTDVEGFPAIPINIYAGVNPRITTGGSKNEDVLLARTLFVDLDNTTIADAMEQLRRTKLPMPTMIVMSGHGVHFYWRLTDPIFDLAYWKSIQKRLIRVFGSDGAIHDASRPMRVPGFYNVNGDPTKCYIHEADASRRYPLENILALLPPEPPTPPTKPKPEKKSLSDNSPTSIDRLSLRGESDEKLRRAKAYADKFESVEDNRNTTAFKRTTALVEKFDLDEVHILPLIERVNDQANDPLDESELNEVVTKAVNHVRRKEKPRGTALEKDYLRTEKYAEPVSEVIELDIWREEMKMARIDSLGQYGSIFFDGSTTGAGKSTADIAAIEKAGKSAIFLPTHDACEEEAAKLTELGLSAAAHPPMNDDTCQMFGTKNKPGPAQRAQISGLNVAQCVCPTCEHFNECKYQQLREVARNADHTICTHTRASLSNFESAKGKSILFIHEDITTLFRPTVKVVRNAKKADIPQVRHLLDIVRIAQAAEDIALTWQDEQAISFAKILKADTNALIAELDSPDLVKAMEDAANAGKEFASLPSVKAVKLKPKIERHDRVDYLLKRAMDRLEITANGPALKLALAYSTGELDQLCVVVDDAKVSGGKPIFTKALVGVWKISTPDNCVVWIENASTTAEAVQDIVGAKVIDKTPQGRLEYKVAPVQYPDADITMQACEKIVRSVVRGLLAKYPDAQKVGIISHRCHQAAIDSLAPIWANRISRKEYFRSGKDRASNSWLDCDLILIIGTPRVPKHAVRDLLIQTGKVDAACRSAKFGDVMWEGKANNGSLLHIGCKGYDDPDWANACNQLVKETLRQAIGRGRGVTDKGVQVVVASNESLGLTLADQPLQLISDSEDETLQLTVSATAANAKYNSLAFHAVNFIVTDTVARLSQYELRTVRSHLSSLSLSGLLTKKGERGGWIVADWLLSAMR